MYWIKFEKPRLFAVNQYKDIWINIENFDRIDIFRHKHRFCIMMYRENHFFPLTDFNKKQLKKHLNIAIDDK